MRTLLEYGGVYLNGDVLPGDLVGGFHHLDGNLHGHDGVEMNGESFCVHDDLGIHFQHLDEVRLVHGSVYGENVYVQEGLGRGSVVSRVLTCYDDDDCLNDDENVFPLERRVGIPNLSGYELP